jgi:hypothetical protein
MKTTAAIEAKKKSFEIATGPKQECRDILVDQATTHLPGVKNIFTLPGREALCVQTFKRHYPQALIQGVERDEATFEIICSKGILCHNSDVNEFAKSKTLPTNHFDIVFLDYYSFFSKTILRDLKAFLGNKNIVHEGKPFILGLTLMKSVRRDYDDVLDFMKENIYLGDKSDVEPDLITTGSAVKNYLSDEFEDLKSIRLVQQLEYQAQAGSTPMYFFCFSITV